MGKAKIQKNFHIIAACKLSTFKGLYVCPNLTKPTLRGCGTLGPPPGSKKGTPNETKEQCCKRLLDAAVDVWNNGNDNDPNYKENLKAAFYKCLSDNNLPGFPGPPGGKNPQEPPSKPDVNEDSDENNNTDLEGNPVDKDGNPVPPPKKK